MAAGIRSSSQKESFAVDLLKDRVARGSFEKREFYSRKNVIIRDRHREDRGIRQSFRNNNGKAPSLT